MEIKFITCVQKLTKTTTNIKTTKRVLGYIQDTSEADKARQFFDNVAATNGDTKHFYVLEEVKTFDNMQDFLKNFNTGDNYCFRLVEETHTPLDHSEACLVPDETYVFPDLNDANAVKHILDKKFIGLTNTYVNLHNEEMHFYETAQALINDQMDKLNDYDM